MNIPHIKACLRIRSALLALLLACIASAQAQDRFWKNVGDIGAPAFLVAGLGAPLFLDGSKGVNHAARTADGFLVCLGLTEALKGVTNERRPNSNSHDSFPSLHTSLSFEVAAAESYFHPNQAPYWYGVAALIGYSRIQTREHHWQDVLAGAALGYGCGQLSASSRRGWLLAPLVENGKLGFALAHTQRF